MTCHEERYRLTLTKLTFITTQKANGQRENAFNKQELDTFCGMRYLYLCNTQHKLLFHV